MNTLTVNELFSGIGAFRKALIRLNVPYEIVGISEIDKYAIKSYEAIYGKTRNYGDISKVEKLNYADLWTYGFPCQDISIAGEQKGLVKGETRSGLLYEVQRLLVQAKLRKEMPKYLVLENVKALVSKKFLSQFESWIAWLDWCGYNTYWQVLNAKDYGMPQNRERVFAISIRKDVDHGFSFPSPISLTLSLADLLEDEVDDRYYLPDKFIAYAEQKTADNIENGRGWRFTPVERERERERERANRQDGCHQRGQPNGQQFHQRGCVLKNQGKVFVKETDLCSTLLARDYKGFGNQEMTGVIEYEM